MTAINPCRTICENTQVEIDDHTIDQKIKEVLLEISKTLLLGIARNLTSDQIAKKQIFHSDRCEKTEFLFQKLIVRTAENPAYKDFERILSTTPHVLHSFLWSAAKSLADEMEHQILK